MSVVIRDESKGAAAARLLYHKFASVGIFGLFSNPEDPLPEGVKRGSPEHLLFLTFTISIDYQRDAAALWSSARRSYEDPCTRYLFDPARLYRTSREQIRVGMSKHRLSLRPYKDAKVWSTLGVTLHEYWNDDPRQLLAACAWSAPRVLQHLNNSKDRKNGHWMGLYPHLCGAKLGPLWLRMLWDTAGASALQDLDQVPMPVDIHVARASLALGVVKGMFTGRLNRLFVEMQKVWFDSVQDIQVDRRKMIALDVNRPLWHLSKHGCSKRDPFTGTCKARKKCDVAALYTPSTIQVSKSRVTLRT